MYIVIFAGEYMLYHTHENAMAAMNIFGDSAVLKFAEVRDPQNA